MGEGILNKQIETNSLKIEFGIHEAAVLIDLTFLKIKTKLFKFEHVFFSIMNGFILTAGSSLD